jgi:predicted DNA-binding transcriptional regulator YafY
MYMLRQLETASPLRLKTVAREFETSVRTIQRDLNVLLMAGHPIGGPDETGGYQLPDGYKPYSIYKPEIDAMKKTSTCRKA